MKPKVLKYVTICVAGHLAENVIERILVRHLVNRRRRANSALQVQ